MRKLPGLVQQLTGTDVAEYSFIAPDDGKINLDWDGEKIEVPEYTK
jgi:hypothetical protein